MKQETIASVAIKSSVPTGVSGAILLGYQLHNWVLGLTAIWVIIQIGFFLYDRFKRKP